MSACCVSAWLQLSVEERRLLLLAALLLPLRKLTYTVKGNKQAPASAFIIREAVKWRGKDVDGVALLHTQVVELAAVHRELAGAGALTLCCDAHHPSHQC